MSHESSHASTMHTPHYTADERNAMRAYLQRSEVRLSTMHRVAVGFLGGAGLLFLLPVFLKDAVLAVIASILDASPIVTTSTSVAQSIGIVLIYLCLLYPFVLSLSIPAIAILLLLKDIVRFYFVGQPPGFPAELFNPRFSLAGIAFSPDESEQVKGRVLRYQYGTDLINFVVSRADMKSRYCYDLIDKPRRMIVPQTRKLPRLIQLDIMDVPSGKPLEILLDEDIVRVHGTFPHANQEEPLLNAPYVDRTVREIDGFNAALGLAGLIDRPLYQEVARMEVSLVRHALNLRRLMLRYFQALLILIWTGLVTFLMLPFLQDTRGRFSLLLVFALAYFIWALLTPVIVQMPLHWLANTSRADLHEQDLRQFKQSDAIQRFGKLTQRLCYFAIASSLAALVLEVMLRL